MLNYLPKSLGQFENEPHPTPGIILETNEMDFMGSFTMFMGGGEIRGRSGLVNCYNN